jgi:LysR family transcriptional regulator, cyn operon transcriptional activator
MRKLRYFAALAECLNFTRAAAKVHVAQSTLSHQIKYLEEEVGCQLFHREGKRVSLTLAGEILLPNVTRCLREIDLGIRALREFEALITDEVNFGLVPRVFDRAYMPECLSAFHTQNPRVRVKVEKLWWDDLPKKVRGGEVDLGISECPPDTSGLQFEPLYHEDLALVTAADHPLASRKRIRMVELHHLSLVLPTHDFSTRRVIDDCFRAAGVKPNIVAELATIPTIFQLIKSSNLGTILARNSAMEIEGLHAVQLQSPTPKRTIGLVWRDSAERTPAARALAIVIRETMRTAIRKKRDWPEIELYAGPNAQAGMAH